eukprot:13719996-Heterocapsa_arctica.AAC.2
MPATSAKWEPMLGDRGYGTEWLTNKNKTFGWGKNEYMPATWGVSRAPPRSFGIPLRPGSP